MDRRAFLRLGLATSGAVALGPSLGGPSFWARAYAAPTRAGEGPYGQLGEPDANGLRLPAGFSSRVVGHSGSEVAATGYVWHGDPDGGAVFPTAGGGWIYVSNSERSGSGGVGAVRFSATGEIEDAYPILEGTSRNCAGGPTPWGTWLSCEEHAGGQVWECDPAGRQGAAVRPMLGTFTHEAAAVDPDGGRVYLTEDHPDGRYYRFTPAAYPALADGVLEAAGRADDGTVRWHRVADPSATAGPTRAQAPGSTPFRGGEGAWYEDGFVYFTTKGDDRVWVHDVAADRIDVLYDGLADRGPLRGVDNVTVAANGDLFVAEDGGNMELVLIAGDDRVVAPFVQVVGHEGSEVTGPAFTPDGSRLYVSSQRGSDGAGLTYEVAGPFRHIGAARAASERPTTTLATAQGRETAGAPNGDGTRGDGGDDDSLVEPVVTATSLALLASLPRLFAHYKAKLEGRGADPAAGAAER